MKQSKIISKQGSAMVLVIIAMSLFLIISTTIMSQINNQIKSNSKLYNETKYKYEAEGIVDEEISNTYSQINKIIKENQNPTHQLGDKVETKVIIEDIDCGKERKKIKLEVEIIKDKERGKWVELGREIQSINIDNIGNKDNIINEFEGVIIEGIYVDSESKEEKYKVSNTIDFYIDNDFNLIYEVTSYNKESIK